MSRHLLLASGFLLLGCLAPIPFLGDLRVATGALLLCWTLAHAVYLAAAWLVMRVAEPGTDLLPPAGAPAPVARGAFRLVLAVAILARITLVPTAPTLSEDAYRYLWDGRLVASGVNPFPKPPSHPDLVPIRGTLFGRLNHPDVPTIYPPAAQIFFGAVATLSATPWALKAAYLPVEGILWLALLSLLRARGLPRERLLLLAWNPLVIVETYGSGHLDVLAAAAIVLALALFQKGRTRRSGALLGVATLIKYTPVLLVIYFARRRAWLLLAAAVGTAALLYLPFVGAGPALFAGLRTYLAHWEFNGSLYPLVRPLVESPRQARLLLAGALVLASLVISARARSATGAALALFTAFLLVSPTVYPWYLVPLIALLPLHPDPGLLLFSGLVALSYLPLPRYHATGQWMLPSWIPALEYGGWAFAAVAGRIASWRGYARRNAWAKDKTPT